MTDIQLKTFHFPYPHHPAPVVHDVVPSYTRVTSRCDEHSQPQPLFWDITHQLRYGNYYTQLCFKLIRHALLS